MSSSQRAQQTSISPFAEFLLRRASAPIIFLRVVQWYLRAEQELDNQFQSMFKERDRAQNQDGNNEISQAAARDAENDKKVREVEASNGKLRQVSTRKIVVSAGVVEVQKVEGDKKAQEVEVGIKRLQ
ncbi:hypothetical protein F4604DRAFT_1684964 [Suillus subluteus]|nr:hypothetical protein F4604DRAFT_1690869 [Suillus subluteus]KAG1858568.1 hypothetical protein F4604DRAFT_1684964 [Suillus subluteus]